MNLFNLFQRINLKTFSIFSVGMMVIYFAFAYLDAYPIMMWDESRLANNAIEMDMSGNWIVTTFYGVPDYGNVKFPLLIWMQVISMRLFGFDEIGMRMPIAFAVLFTCIFLYWYAVRYIKDYIIGLLSVAVLITSYGYMHVHSGRTGDYDALLTLFTTIYVLILYQYFQDGSQRKLFWAINFFTLAVFTKSIAGAIYILPIALYALYSKQLIPILKSKSFYRGLILFFISIGGYVIIRAFQQSDYLESIWVVDTIGRAVNAIDGHDHPFKYHFENFYLSHFDAWYKLLLIALAFFFYKKDHPQAKFVRYLFLLVILHMLVISSCKSKLYWYTLPNFPLCSLIVAIFIREVIQHLNSSGTRFFSAIFLVAIFAKPIQVMYDKIYLGHGFPIDQSVKSCSQYIKQHDFKGRRVRCIPDSVYFADMAFYAQASKRRGNDIETVYDHAVLAGDIVLIYRKFNLDIIDRKWKYRIIAQNQEFYCLELLALK